MKRSCKEKVNWVHLIGISGVTMAPMANAFKENGWFITGSDKAFYPPMSTYLIEKAITVEVGFRKEHLTRAYYRKKYSKGIRSGLPDFPTLVIIGASISSKNPELLFAKKKKLTVKSYPEVLEKHQIVDKNSIVITGTYGKTTITALLVNIFHKANKKISYMIGALANNIKDGIKLKDKTTEWSITEGDEYITSCYDQTSKFFHYHPKYLVITSAEHDHTDIFPTKKAYVDNFKKLVESVPQDGLIVASKEGENIEEVVENAKAKVIFYEYNEKDFSYKTKLIGKHNKINITGAATLARNLDIPAEAIKDGIETFSGIKRRLEVRMNINDCMVIDDFGSTPSKARGSLSAVKEEYPKHKIVVVFEPNAGNRTKEAIPLYNSVFKNATEVIIPRLSTTKTRDRLFRLGGKELSEVISKTHNKVNYFPIDNELIDHLIKIKGKRIILFTGSHGFRGMIEKTIESISAQ
ncbi:hypothetical protein JW796_04055 [Candidatus Dojkabacteria bacterium]|nr:hypothetical protein [Candidatus Dojkabacteria bacterium]